MATFCVVIITWLLYYFQVISCMEKDTKHPVSCMDLDDGIHFIRPILFIDNDQNKDQYPSILVRCHNGWIIFDYSLDPNIQHYFTSFMPITDDFGSMNVGLEHINWPKWLQIKNTQFTVSEDCNACDTDSNEADLAYYMTGNYYQCSFATKSLCDMSPSTLQCNQCSGLMHDDNIYPGLCTHIVLNIDDDNINDERSSHQECVSAKWNYLPSIGLNGRFCPCFKPQKHQNTLINTLHITADDDTMPQNEQKSEDCNQVIELTNDDFLYGTYRITSCGIYTLMEDIVLNMNAPPATAYDSLFSPNDIDTNYWWPTAEQQQDETQYPSDNFIGAYTTGFFAGIAVETNNVVIDLNGKTLSMHYDFYIQQRVFSLIELGSKPFLSGQGPVNYGSNFNHEYPANIVIKDGFLGLTSHHAIHGNNNRNIEIKSLKIFDFEIAGISMNGFHDLVIDDVQIGPNYQLIPVSSQYTHGRFMLQRLQYIPDKDSKYVVINHKKVFVNDIIDTLREEMDEAYAYSHGMREDIDAESNLYINNDGLPHGATLYGIFLNSEGASVFGIGLSPGYASNAVLRNVIVKELRSNPEENVRAQLTRGPFNDLLDMKRIIDFENEGKYRATSYSNAQYALVKLIPDSKWSVLGHSFISKPVMRWIEEDKKLPNKFKCNSDVMLHLSKGIFGIRVDNVRDIKIEGYLNIESIHNLGAFGEDTLCGKYFNGQTGGHHNQQYPEQIGYTGNEVHALSFIGSTLNIDKYADIYIHDLISSRGSCFGINFYKETDIEMDANAYIKIDNVHSGAYLTAHQVNKLSAEPLPNTVPRTCAIDMWSNAENKVKIENIESKCITGFDECSFKYSMIDEKYTKDNEILNKDLMIAAIDNQDCRYDEHEESILVSLSQISKFHLETLHLLQMQSKPMQYGMDSGDFYIIVVFGAVTIFKSLMYYLLRSKRKRNAMPNMELSERTPLLLSP